MRLHELKPPPGSHPPLKGLAGASVPAMGRPRAEVKRAKGTFRRGVRRGFEGGQMPLFQRLPKRGFSNKKFRTEWSAVNVEVLNRFAAGTVVTPELLQENGLVKSLNYGIKILGKGSLQRN